MTVSGIFQTETGKTIQFAYLCIASLFQRVMLATLTTVLLDKICPKEKTTDGTCLALPEQGLKEIKW
jgi:hypothetical protein